MWQSFIPNYDLPTENKQRTHGRARGHTGAQTGSTPNTENRTIDQQTRLYRSQKILRQLASISKTSGSPSSSQLVDTRRTTPNVIEQIVSVCLAQTNANAFNSDV